MDSEKRTKNSLVGLVGLVLLLTLLSSAGYAQIPQKMNYQGYLTNASGVPINGTVQMVFSIYHVSSGGSSLWTETQNVTVNQGIYSVNLGDVTSITLPFDAQYYLGVQVGADPEMTPRKILTSVGYAFRALTVESIGSHSHSGADITSGTVSEARIDPLIARDSEVSSSISTHAANASAHHTRYTDAEAVAAIKAADGSGSGLDADLLDGQDSAYYLSLANQTGTLPVSQGGTGATTAPLARANLGAAASGGNSDITSLSGLSTPLSVSQGGTGGATASAARTSLDVPGLSVANSFTTGTQTIQTGGASTKGVVVQGAVSQSANLQEWQDSVGTAVASVDPSGKFTGDGSGLSGVEKRTALSACGTISTSGSYYVTQNLSTTGTCIEVTANDVTIDLNGFTLTGDGTGLHYGVYIYNVSNVEVKNGTVRSFDRGIYANWSGATRSNRVINVRAMGNGIGIDLLSYNNLVKHCTAADSTTTGGIDVENGSIVTNNTAYNNQGWGIFATGDCTVTNNTAYNNQGNGIYVSFSTVTNNTAYGNTGDGINSSFISTVTNNTASNNQGIGINAGEGSTVTNNTASGNQGYGIAGSFNSTVTNNTAYGNNQSNDASSGGIYVDVGCVVKNNTLRFNLQNNIYVDLSDNAIEENLVTSSTNGIFFNSSGNFYANNRARGNTTNYNGGGSQTDGGGNVEF
jgi:parallel beta-helix repeat protein